MDYKQEIETMLEQINDEKELEDIYWFIERLMVR